MTGTTFEVPNLDDTDTDDLRQLARVFGTLHRYAKLKAQAMERRARGDLRGAGYDEDVLESLYTSLPEWARW